jgi:hypothetical protein
MHSLSHNIRAPPPLVRIYPSIFGRLELYAFETFKFDGMQTMSLSRVVTVILAVSTQCYPYFVTPKVCRYCCKLQVKDSALSSITSGITSIDTTTKDTHCFFLPTVLPQCDNRYSITHNSSTCAQQ